MEGAALLDDAAGAAFGCGLLAASTVVANDSTHLRDHAHDEALLFDVVRFDRLVILENLAYIARLASAGNV